MTLFIRLLFACMTMVGCTTAVVGNVFAASHLVDEIQVALNSGKTANAASAIRARLSTSPDDAQAQFALGTVQFLQALETLGRNLYKHGLKSTYDSASVGLAGLPILRLPIPKNPNPATLSYNDLRTILKTFVSDLAIAESSLSKVSLNTTIKLRLNIGLIRLDFNNDGSGSDDEALWQVFKAVTGAPGLNEAVAKSLVFDFDNGDVLWLRAYCHLLMAIGQFPLAYDWRTAFEITFHDLFLKADVSPEAQQFFAQRVQGNIAFDALTDLVAFIHLARWPVVEPLRLKSVLEHMSAMVHFSRESWKSILSETDNDREWIPNPKQTGGPPGMTVTEYRVEHWALFLDELDAILKGKKLLPHWRFNQGFNLRRFFL